MDFLLVKKPTIIMKPHFFEQMEQFEEILVKNQGYSLTKDWTSPPRSTEEQTLTNTYLNTIQKVKKSPRASFTDKRLENRVGISWHKKIKFVIPNRPFKNLDGQILGNKKAFSTMDIQSYAKAQDKNEDVFSSMEASNSQTEKKNLKVILKTSTSTKSLDLNTIKNVYSPNLKYEPSDTATVLSVGSTSTAKKPSNDEGNAFKVGIRRPNSQSRAQGGLSVSGQQKTNSSQGRRTDPRFRDRATNLRIKVDHQEEFAKSGFTQQGLSQTTRNEMGRPKIT